MLARFCQCPNGVIDGSRTGCNSQRGAAALQLCDALLKSVLGRICQTAIDVTGVTQAETVCGVLTIVKYIRCGLVNRNGSCIGDGIGGFLADMQLQSFKAILFFFHDKILLVFFLCGCFIAWCHYSRAFCFCPIHKTYRLL